MGRRAAVALLRMSRNCNCRAIENRSQYAFMRLAAYTNMRLCVYAHNSIIVHLYYN